MTITEYIAYLRIAEKDHGDCDMEDSYGNPASVPEFIDGVLVYADKA